MDHNEEFLREASTVIVDQKLCVQKFNTSSFKVDSSHFQKFICTFGPGNIDSEGNIIDYGERVTNETTMQTTITWPWPWPWIPPEDIDVSTERSTWYWTPEYYEEPEDEKSEESTLPWPWPWLPPDSISTERSAWSKPTTVSHQPEYYEEPELYKDPVPQADRRARIEPNQDDYYYDYVTR